MTVGEALDEAWSAYLDPRTYGDDWFGRAGST